MSSDAIQSFRERVYEAWNRGERLFVEDLVPRDSALALEEEQLLELILWEFQVRKELSRPVTAEEYYSRFPEHTDRLRRLFLLHNATDETIAGMSNSVSSQGFVSENFDFPGRIPLNADGERGTNGSEGGLQVPSSIQDQRGACAPVNTTFGRYRMEYLLGRGGFGEVYRAWDDQLKRAVAIKVTFRKFLGPEAGISYLAEAQSIASLDHPNIVPVYDIGQSDSGDYYIVTKLIEGRDLAAHVRSQRPSRTEAISIVASVADALQHAHARGLVHRDVKPANILIDRQRRAYLTDFGIALKEENFGRSAAFAGTPQYMSPEQARGEGHRVDGRSDLYSLGVVLYELLTGRRPFQSENSIDLLRRISDNEVRPPRQIDDTISRELERICLKALALRATDRYSTGRDFSEDLMSLLQQESNSRTSASSQKTPDPGDMRLPTALPEAASIPLTPTPSGPIRVIPRGLRSFDQTDADFFLELLPGPVDRMGYPDIVRFWKRKIESTDSDAGFSVGLIYGPSGCGKSSLIKAGVLPRLSTGVLSVYVEATGRETELRLSRAIQSRIRGMPGERSLKDTLAAIRRGQGLMPGQTLLIVIDQFEQWLHSHEDYRSQELTAALRQCDGIQVRCLLLVRDDFWLSVSRFMRELEIPLLEAVNSSMVDLFDVDHAARVLGLFGRAFGRLPDNSAKWTQDQRKFVQQAISGLAQDRNVVCVRLALFAEMMKSRTWTTSTLKDVGGTEGVGTTFLEETFSSRSAPPRYRHHQDATRAVLAALLPDVDTNIKGRMQSYGALLQASGYMKRPEEFAELLRILDSELRLITPTDPEGEERHEPASDGRNIEQHYYQLTHDYLVHSLRDWLTRKLRETRRGRAEIKLAERSSLWNSRPETRHLPSLAEWIGIRSLTDSRHWTPPQRLMMNRAFRVHGVRCGIALILLAVAVGIAVSFGKSARDKVAAARNSEARQLAIALKNEKEAQRLQGIAEEQTKRADATAAEAQQQRAAAENAHRKAAGTAYDALVSQAAIETAGGDMGRAQAILQNTDWELRGLEFGRLQSLATGTPLVFSGHTGAVQGVACSPDCSRIATISMDGTARVWNASNGHQVCRLSSHSANAAAICWHPDGKRVVSGANDGTARLWSADTAMELCPAMQHPAPVFSARWNPSGTQFATGCADGIIRFWDVSGHEGSLQLIGHEDRIQSLAWSPDGNRILTGSGDCTARIWSIADGKELQKFTTHRDWVSAVAWSPDGNRVVTGGKDRIAVVWDANTGSEIAIFREHTNEIHGVSWSPDGAKIVTVSSDSTACIWNPVDGMLTRKLSGHAGRVFGVDWSTDGTRILTGSQDSTARIWNLTRDHAAPITLTGHTAGVSSADWSPSGDRIITASYDATARIWDANSGRELSILEGHRGVLWGARWSADQNWLVTASADGTAGLWNAEKFQRGLVLSPQQMPVLGAAVSPDGNRIVTVSDDRTAQVWNRSGNILVTSFTDHTAPVWSAAFSANGKSVLTASEDATARIWEAETGRSQAVFRGHTGLIRSAVWSPNEEQLITGSDDGTARIWDVRTQTETAILRGHSGQVFSVDWSPDGTRVATGSADGTARIWNPLTGLELISIRVNNDEVWPVSFSPDGTRLLVGGMDGIARIWRFPFVNTVVTLPPGSSNASLSFSEDSQKVVIRHPTEPPVEINLPPILFPETAIPPVQPGEGPVSPNGRFELRTQGGTTMVVARSLLNAGFDPWKEDRELRNSDAWDWYVLNAVEAENRHDDFAVKFFLQKLAQLEIQNPELRTQKEDVLTSLDGIISLEEQRVRANPDDSKAQLNLARCCGKMGDLLQSRKRLEASLSYLLRHQAYWESQQTLDPANTGVQRTLMETYRTIGKLMLDTGQQELAIDQFQRFRKIAESFAENERQMSGNQQLLQEANLRMGDAFLRLGRILEAVECTARSVQIAKSLTAEFPDNRQFQFSLFAAQQQIADAHLKQRKTQDALKLYDEALVSGKQLVASAPDDPDAVRELMKFYQKRGETDRERLDFAAAHQYLETGRELLHSFAARTGQTTFAYNESQLGDFARLCDTTRRAVEDMNSIFEMDRAVVSSWLIYRFQLLLEYSRLDPQDVPKNIMVRWSGTDLRLSLLREAIHTADRLRNLEGSTAANPYNAGCCFALCIGELEKLDSREFDLQKAELQAKAIEALKAAVTAGWTNREHMVNDPDLESIRVLPEFQEIVSGLASPQDQHNTSIPPDLTPNQ